MTDSDISDGKRKAMSDAMMAKFSQNSELTKTLLETKDAVLNHFVEEKPLFYLII